MISREDSTCVSFCMYMVSAVRILKGHCDQEETMSTTVDELKVLFLFSKLFPIH